MGYPQKISYPDKQQKKMRSKEIEGHVQEFLNKGGVIKKLLPEESALLEKKHPKSKKLFKEQMASNLPGQLHL